MNFESLYKLSLVSKRTALHVEIRNEIISGDEYALHNGTLRPNQTLIFDFMKGASGSTINDFIGTSTPPLTLISDRVVEVLQPFKGWATYPVEVYGKKGELIPGYHGLAITGRCGPIDDSKSKAVWIPPPVPEGKPYRKWIGLFFDPATWDGSDVFLSSTGGGMLITDAVKTAMQRAKISNVKFTPLTEAENMSSVLLFGKKP